MLEQVLLQTTGDTITPLVAAVGVLLGAVAGIIGALLPYIRGRDTEVANKVAAVATSLKETDRWILENQEKVATLVSVVQNLSPDARKAIEQNGVSLTTLTQEIKSVSNELDRVHAILPKPVEK